MVLVKLGNKRLHFRNGRNHHRERNLDSQLPTVVHQAQLKKLLRFCHSDMDMGRISLYRRRKRLLRRLNKVMYTETWFKKWGPLLGFGTIIVMFARSI